MSRTPFPSRRPRRRGGYRPQVEALEGRLAPGSLLGAPECPPADPDDTAERRDREDEDLAALAAMAAGSEGAIRTTRPVTLVADPSVVVPGSSTVVRREDSLTVHLHASGLEPGAYSFWMQVELPGLPPVAGRLGGHVVGESGIVNFSANVRGGDVVGDPPFPGREGTLQDPLHVRVILVVRSHGPAEPGRIHEQTHTLEPDGAFNFLRSIHEPPPGP